MMKINNQKVSSLFQKKRPIKGRGIKDFFLLSLLILLILLAIRFANLYLIWHLTRLELQNNPMVEIKNYIFLGLSTRNTAQSRLTEFARRQTSGVAVVAYYTLLTPSNFLISNPGSPLFVDIGRISVLVKPGITWIQISPEEIIELEWKQSRQSVFFGFSIFSSLFDGYKFFSPGTEEKKENAASRISYVENQLEISKYLKISTMIYFFLPILLIFWLSSIFGKGFNTAFLFYFGLFLLFDFKGVFVTIPFSWLFRLVNGELSNGFSVVIAFCILILFLILSLVGIANLRQLEGKKWEKSLVFVFIVMPLFIRF